MPKSTTGETETPSGGEGQPLNTVGDSIGADLDFIKSLIEEPATTAPVKGNEPIEAATTPEITPTTEPAEPSDREEFTTTAEEEAGALPPELQTRIDKRIGKEVAKTKTERERAEAAEAKADELEAKLAQRDTEPLPATTTTQAPLANLQTPEQCAQLLEQAESAMDWAEQQLVRLEDEPETVLAELGNLKVDFGAEPTVAKAKGWLTSVRRNADRVARRHVPQRLAYLQAEASASQDANTHFPWWKDRTSADYAEAQSILRAYPEVRNRPNWKLVVGTFVEGMKAVKARIANKIATPKPKVLPKPQPGAPASAAPEMATGKDASAANARAAWLKNPGDHQAQERFLEASLLAE